MSHHTKHLEVHEISRWFAVAEDEVRDEVDGAQTWHYQRHPGSALVVPLTPDGLVILHSEWRVALRRECLELPGGRIDGSETGLACAQRELAEETGFAGGEWAALGVTWASPGSSDESVSLFEAAGVQSESPTSADNIAVPFREALAWAVAGKIDDAASCVAVFRAAFRRAYSP
jgi:ADP-ribose pyrophosphatase